MNKHGLWLLFTLGIGVGIGMASRELARPAPLEAAGAERYRVLQDRDLYAEAAAARKEELQQKLDKLAVEGWELLNPSAAYIEDKGFVVTTGAVPDGATHPDRRAVLILKRAVR
jgi:hypothetical protein